MSDDDSGKGRKKKTTIGTDIEQRGGGIGVDIMNEGDGGVGGESIAIDDGSSDVVIGTRVISTGPGIGMRVVQCGPGVGFRSVVIVRGKKQDDE